MASQQVANRKASQSLRGQVVRVTLDSAESLAKLPLIVKGDRCATVSSGVFGTVTRVDYEGNSFWVRPYMPTGNFASTSTPGYLASGELINLV